MATARDPEKNIRQLVEAAKLAVMDAQDACSDERIATYLNEAFDHLDGAWVVSKLAEEGR